MSKEKIEIILTAVDKGISNAFSGLGKGIDKAMLSVKAFNATANNGIRVMGALEGAVGGLVGAYLGLEGVSSIVSLMEKTGTAAFTLEASLKAASREFADTGSMEEWGASIDRLSDKLQIYSKSDLQTAAAQTVDMTKRLGFSNEQMEQMIELTGDLSAGRTTLSGGIERVTAAMRGEAEASEYLGLTLNETYVKAWYEASGAMQGAWKDLNDLQKAQVRYQVFLEQAIPMQGKAADSITTFAGAIALVKRNIEDSVAGSETATEAMANMAEVLGENSEAIGDLVGRMVTWAAKVVELVIANQDLIVSIGKWVGAIYGFTKAAQVVGVLINTVRGLNAAFTVLTGKSMITALAGLRLAMKSTVVSLTTMSGAFAAATGAVSAFFLGLKLGEWLYLKKIMAEIQEETKTLARRTDELKGRYAKISRATGVTVTSMEELDRAVEKGLIKYDDVTGEWVKGAKTMAEAVAESGDKQEDSVLKATDAMKKAYKGYVDEVKKLQGEIASREQSLQEQLREMARSGMSDYSAWKDRKKEAQEYEAAAKKAAAAGDFAKAVEYADKARGAYADLNEEVKDGDQVLISQQTALKTAMEGVERAGKLATDALKKQEAAAAAAAQEIDAATTDDLAAEFGSVESSIDSLGKATTTYTKTIVKVGDTWTSVWKSNEKGAMSVLDGVQDKINSIDGTTITVKVKEVAARAAGGLIHAFARGGALGGYGGGDRIPALLEAGEFVIRKEAVRLFGSGLFDALNNFRMPAIPRFATGGSVGATSSAGGSGEIVNINFTFPSGSSVGPFQGTRAQVRAIEREQRHMSMGRSG